MANPTEQVALGRTSLTVPRLSLGTAPLAHDEVTPEAAQGAFDAALETAPMLVDTAPFYTIGVAEQRVGAGIAGKRDRVVLSTKVGRLIRPDADGKPSIHEDYSYDGAMRSLEESMVRLGADHIDVVHIHDADHNFDAALAGAFKALDRLRADGTIKAVSAGMNQWQMLSRFMDHAQFDCFLLAGRHTLLERTAEAEFFPKVLAAGVGIILGGVFNSGVLANPHPGATHNYQTVPPVILARVLELDAICARHGVPLKAAALQFPLRNPAVTTCLVGVHSAAEWRENVALMQLPIPDALWDELG